MDQRKGGGPAMTTGYKVNSIKYTRRWNLGQYEHEELTVDAAVEEGENASEVLEEVMEFVLSKGKLQTNGKDKPSEKVVVADGPTPKPNTPVPTADKTKAKKEKAAAPPKKEAIEEKKEEKVEEKTEEQPQRKTKVVGKVTKYNRNLDLHKKLLSETLEENHKGWRANASKAKEASIKLENDEVDFLDAEGKVLESFKEALAEAMG